MLSDKTIEVTNSLRASVQMNYDIDPNFIILEPLGLNAGLVFSTAKIITEVSLDELIFGIKLNEELFKTWNLVFTNGWTVHTTLFDYYAGNIELNERRDMFNLLLDSTEVGRTFLLQDKKSSSVISFTNLRGDIIKKNRVKEELSATLSHEFFHHLIHTTEFFKDFPLYKESSNSEEELISDVERLKDKEVEDLSLILGNSYANQDWEEFICEAFSAKLHPFQPFKERFQKKLFKLTNF